MKALAWHGNHDVRVDNVPGSAIQEPTDAIVRNTSTAICGSDLHLYEVLGPYIEPGDILGHEPMGIVEEVGSGVYGGTATPMNMLQLFDKGVVITQGQAHVKRWIDDLMPLVTDDSDPLGVEGLATHKLPLAQAPHGYEIFQKKQDGAIKVVLEP